MKHTSKYRLFFSGLLLIEFANIVSCKKLVESPPPTQELTSENVYTTDATATSVLTGIYTTLSEFDPLAAQYVCSVSLASGLSADELTLYGGAANANTILGQFYLNDLTAGNTKIPGAYMWDDFYAKLYTTNLALSNLEASTSLTPAVRQQLMGECTFLRAFFYFYLVNLYGAVPLTTTSDYTINASLARALQASVYGQIISDLLNAQKLLTVGYVGADAETATTERTRPDQWAATALLARTYLYTGKFDSAELEATSVINMTSLYDTTPLNSTFLKNSKEAIWQLQPVVTGWNTPDAQVFILPSAGPTSNQSETGYPVYLSPELLGAFESADQRRIDWVDSVIVNGTAYYYAFKYKSATLNAPVTEYTMMLRLGEQYLIRAEARAQQGNIIGPTGALADLNVIRMRAGLPNYSGAIDQTSVLAAILHERQVELFTEWGHRWLDLKRAGTVNTVMDVVGPSKGGSWNSDWQYYPLPLYDITQDPNLVQNAGY